MTGVAVSREDINKVFIIDYEKELSHLSKAIGEDKESVVVRIEKFSITANNVTYCHYGTAMQYFDFFPLVDPSHTSLAMTPAWGYGIIESVKNTNQVKVGERLYGYFPMATRCILELIPAKSNTHSSPSIYAFRPQLPADRMVYNTYTRLSSDELYSKKFEDEVILFRPLFMTSFLLDDYLHHTHKYFNLFAPRPIGSGVEGQKSAKRKFSVAVIVSSASSKTGYCFAHLLKAHRRFDPMIEQGISTTIVGLSGSPTSLRFISTSLAGIYDRVSTYDAFLNDEASDYDAILYCDFLGDKLFYARLAKKFNGRVAKRVVIGNTKWQSTMEENNKDNTDLNFEDKNSIFFFAPSHFLKRNAELGGNKLLQQSASAWHQMLASSNKWVTIKPITSIASFRNVWEQTIRGSMDPAEGLIVALPSSPPPPPSKL